MSILIWGKALNVSAKESGSQLLHATYEESKFRAHCRDIKQLDSWVVRPQGEQEAHRLFNRQQRLPR
jgi:hypothetical protein